MKRRRGPSATKTRRRKPVAITRQSQASRHRSGRLFQANERLIRERDEALEQQTAAADVLKAISSSTFDLQTILDTLVETAARLCHAKLGLLFRRDGKLYWGAAFYGYSPEFKAFYATHPIAPGRSTTIGRTALEGKTVHIPDVLADSEYKFLEAQKIGQYRANLGVPLLRAGESIGALSLARSEPEPFTARQIELVESFAAQAVIAIENARLLNELRQRTDDLTESLEQQTASGEILASISGSLTDTKPVFDAIVRNLLRLFGSRWACVQVLHDGIVHMPAIDGEAASKKLIDYYPQPLNENTMGGRAMQSKQVLQFSEIENNSAVPLTTQQFAREFGFRSAIFAPMIRGNRVIGAVGVANFKPTVFNDKQVALIKAFADQAVIAIENTRLLKELRESLQQQTATADVLKVISRSAFDLQTVLNTLTESAARLCGADKGAIMMREGDAYWIRANYGFADEAVQYALSHPIQPDRGSATGRVALEGKAIHIPDVLADPEYRAAGYQKTFGYRSILGIPLLREGTTIGTFTLTRDEMDPFNDKQIELATTFADQAVIAIENVRLFDEVQTRTRELARSIEELQALGEVSQAVNSTLDLETVLTTIVGRAVQLSHTDAGAIYVFDEERKAFRLHATYGMSETMIAAIRDRKIGLGDANIGAAATQRKPIQVPDIRNEPTSPVNEIILREGYRSILIIPLLRPDHIVGALVVRRKTPGEFPQSTVELLQTFADQSVVAIQNARLFEKVEARTRELAKSLEDLRTAQDRLVQTEKLASLGQLTAGIAHEIKNPLNFVNNFSAVSIELIDELRQALAVLDVDNKPRAQISEIADMLQGNLDKVVQHGKRADSIVKNMLLHSRQGSGDHRPIDINTLVEESLNLAYHGARAEKQGFNIALEKSFDSAAGEVDVFPQEITRVLLNLISNGFYAATKRKTEGGDYKPTLAAATKNLGDSVEIRIRDNGTGIPAEVKEQMFNPFFTTKPVGEGTGLGLSISHDIIVKQHGGAIEVDTEPGEFTEIRIILPRAAASLTAGRA